MKIKSKKEERIGNFSWAINDFAFFSEAGEIEFLVSNPEEPREASE